MPHNMPTHRLPWLLLWGPTIFVFAPLHIWAAWHLSFTMILKVYFFLFSSIMNCLAMVILFAGLVLPPASIAYWVWEKYQEPLLDVG